MNARVTMSFSFAFTSASFQKYSWRPCTHSKYDTTTPPAFARMSGRTSTPLSSRISSAAGVVGPFAPSTMIFAFTCAALSVGDHLLQRTRREHVALEQQQLFVRDRVCAPEAAERTGLALVRDRGLHVDPVRVREPRRRVGDGDDRRAVLGEELREERADVAEALHRDGRPLERRAAACAPPRERSRARRARSLPRGRASRRSSAASR